MPIKPENRHFYKGQKWLNIRMAILERANHKCEYCHIENYTPLKNSQYTIVLTIAHLDQDPSNNNFKNLKALCQRCHNRLDAPFRAQHAAQTREKRLQKDTIELF